MGEFSGAKLAAWTWLLASSNFRNSWTFRGPPFLDQPLHGENRAPKDWQVAFVPWWWFGFQPYFLGKFFRWLWQTLLLRRSEFLAFNSSVGFVKVGMENLPPVFFFQWTKKNRLLPCHFPLSFRIRNTESQVTNPQKKPKGVSCRRFRGFGETPNP